VLKIVSLFIIISAISACTKSEKWGTPWDRFIGQDGVKVKLYHNSKDEEVREIWLPSGVHVVDNRDKNGRISSVEFDDSKEGAVLCTRELLVMLKNELEFCYKNQYANEINTLNIALDKIDDFIVKNSLTTISKVDLNRKDIEKVNQGFTQKQCVEKTLKDGDVKKFIGTIKDGVNNMTPRPPVLNPCL